MVGIEAVAQAETVSERRGAEQNRLAGESGERPQPCRDIGGDKDEAEAQHAAARVVRTVVKQAAREMGEHRGR
jgi:hypothetical protein